MRSRGDEKKWLEIKEIQEELKSRKENDNWLEIRKNY